MRPLLLLFMALFLSSCTHHLIGREIKPFHSIEKKGHENLKGSWVSIDYYYKLNNGNIDIEGFLSFNKDDEIQEWSHVKVEISFIFIDKANIVKDVKREYVSVGGGYLGQEPFKCSFPYSQEYTSMSVDVRVSGYY